MSTNAYMVQTGHNTPVTMKTDEDNLNSEIKNFINEMKKLQTKQVIVEKQMVEQEVERKEMVA